MERAFFFDTPRGVRLYGVLHTPAGPGNGAGIVMCAPFFEEKLWAQRVYVTGARHLAARGFSVLRYDAGGTGDSEGEHAALSLDTLDEDLAAAQQQLRSAAGVGSVGLLGTRAGALHCVVHAAARRGASFLVLWQPVVSMEQYFTECLRSNLATQMVLYGKQLSNRQALIEKMRGGACVSVDGYPLGWALYESMAALQLEARDLTGVPALLAQVGRREGEPRSKEYASLAAACEGLVFPEPVAGDHFWRETRNHVPRVDPLFGLTADFAAGVAGA